MSTLIASEGALHGGPVVSRRHAEALARRGMTVRVAAAQGEPGPRKGFDVEIYPTGRERADPFASHLPDAVAASALRGIIDRFRPDIVYDVHGAACAVEAAADAGVPVVSMVGDYTWYCLQSFLVDSRYRRCAGPESASKCFACLSRNYPLRWRGLHALLKPPARAGLLGFRLWDEVAIAREYRARMRGLVGTFVVGDRQAHEFLAANGVPEASLVRIPQGLPAEALAPRPRDSLAPVADRPLRLGFVGRPHADKGIHVIAEAFDKLPRDLPVELWIVHSELAAPENVRPRFPSARRFDEAVAGGRIKLIRPARQAEVFELMARVDVGVVPSLAYESPSLALLEFVAQGTPIVRSESRGMEHVVRDGVNGRTFPYGDAGALAAVIREIVADPSLIGRWRAALPAIGSDDDYSARLAGVFDRLRPVRGRAHSDQFQHV